MENGSGLGVVLNEAAVKFLQLPPHSKGRKLDKMISNSEIHHIFEEVITRQKPQEKSINLPPPQARIIHIHGVLLRDINDSVIGVLLVLHDITHIRKLEKIWQDFVANVSHELKTPITLIKGFTETLQEGALHDHQEAERFLNCFVSTLME